MTTTVVGQLVTADGANVKRYVSLDPEHIFAPVRHRSWTIPAAEIRSAQGAEIPLRLDHGQPSIGRIIHLERRAADDGSLWCVGELNVDIYPERGRDYFLSVEATFGAGVVGSDIEIRGACLCEKSCMVGLQPVTLLRDGLDQHGRRPDAFTRSLLARASEARLQRRSGQPLLVHELDTFGPGEPAAALLAPLMGALEYRAASVRDVSEGRRVIEVIVMPYERPANVVHRGRVVSEVVSRGAFADIREQRGKVHVNRDHDTSRLVGRAVRFDPSDQRGLIAELRLSRTPLGNESLALAADGVLDISAGFGIVSERWEQSNRRRIDRARLVHIALVPDAAYTDARVLSVRADRPNLARALAV